MSEEIDQDARLTSGRLKRLYLGGLKTSTAKMKRSLVFAVILNIFFWFDVQAGAGPRHSGEKRPGNVRQTESRIWLAPGTVRHRLGYPAPYRRPRHYYGRGHPSIVIVTPYGTFFDPAAPRVVTAPFFCILHNRGFVSRVGLLDHLSGTHRIALNSAAAICPDGAESCIFPYHE